MSRNEESLFEEALAQPDPRERAAFLDRACADDPALRAAGESRLAACGAGGCVAAPAAALADTVTDPVPTPGVGIGPYELREKLGEGGCGLVFRAERQHPVRRQVAVKVIKPGMHTR